MPRKPGTIPLVIGVIALPLGLLLWVGFYVAGQSGVYVYRWPLTALWLLCIVGGPVCLVVGAVRRLLAR